MTTFPSPSTCFSASEAVQRIERSSLRVQQPASSGDMVSLAMGEPGFDTPEPILQAAYTALREGYTHYAPLKGDADLCGALSTHISNRYSRHPDPDEVLVTHGGTAGLAAAILSIVDPGDRVVIPDPTYSLYADLVNMAGGIVVPMQCDESMHWDTHELERVLVGAKLFIFCNPGNPTGVVHSQAEIESLGRLASTNDVLVIADEAYSDLVFSEQGFTSALDVTSLQGRTLYCQTFSKSYAMTGWRVGYLYGPSTMIKAAARMHNTVNGSVNSVVQRAALVALKECAADVARMRECYRRRREIMLEGLDSIYGLSVGNPEGAFYCFPSYDLDIPSVKLVELLRQGGVALRPGSEFGAGGEQHLRLSYAASEEDILEGISRLARGLKALR